MKSLLLSVLLFALPVGAYSQAPARPGRTITPTRQVAQFSELEDQWAHAIQRKDQSALDRLLTDEFEILTPLATNPVERDEFVEATGNLKLESYRISQMTMHDFGDTAVVNFLANVKGLFRGRDWSGQYFVVDVWRKNGDTWQAAVRYLSKSGTAAKSQARPTGKE
jgi:ketosteroid isomerase-like protein